MNKLNTLMAAGLLTAGMMISTNVLAADSIASTGVYVGAGITPVIVTGHGGSAVDPGVSAALGYRINNNFAIESSYTGFVEPFVTGHIIDLTAKGFLPLTPKFSVFGKVGAAYFNANAEFNFWFIHEHVSKSVFAPEVGVGLDYNFTPNLAAELGVSALPVESNLVVVPATLGLRYTFG